MSGCASSIGIGVPTNGVGVRHGSTGALGTGAALLTALVWELCGGDGAVSTGTTTKKYTSVMVRVCHSRSRFLSCMYIHDKFMTESR